MSYNIFFNSPPQSVQISSSIRSFTWTWDESIISVSGIESVSKLFASTCSNLYVRLLLLVLFVVHTSCVVPILVDITLNYLKTSPAARVFRRR